MQTNSEKKNEKWVVKYFTVQNAVQKAEKKWNAGTYLMCHIFILFWKTANLEKDWKTGKKRSKSGEIGLKQPKRGQITGKMVDYWSFQT